MNINDLWKVLNGLTVPEALAQITQLMEKYPDFAGPLTILRDIITQSATLNNEVERMGAAGVELWNLALHNIGPVNQDGGLTV